MYVRARVRMCAWRKYSFCDEYQSGLVLTETNSIRQEVDFNFINNFHYHYTVDNSCHGNNNPYQLGSTSTDNVYVHM